MKITRRYCLVFGCTLLLLCVMNQVRAVEHGVTDTEIVFRAVGAF
jgi:hypothetical protein